MVREMRLEAILAQILDAIYDLILEIFESRCPVREKLFDRFKDQYNATK